MPTHERAGGFPPGRFLKGGRVLEYVDIGLGSCDLKLHRADINSLRAHVTGLVFSWTKKLLLVLEVTTRNS